MTDVKRSYRSPRREEQARRTRQRIVHAARRLWVERGFASTTIEAIASKAKVSVQTIYGVFGSKGGILTALLGELESGAGGETLMADLRSAAGAREQLTIIAVFNRRLFEGGADVIATAIGSAAADRDVGAWVAEGDRRRREGQRHLVNAWHATGALKPGLSASEAADILYTLTSPEVYLLLVRTCGWPPDRYESWLTETSTSLLMHVAED